MPALPVAGVRVCRHRPALIADPDLMERMQRGVTKGIPLHLVRLRSAAAADRGS
jgi:hypothetical protein